MIRIAVIQYPGTNCEYETARAVESAGMEARLFRWNEEPRELEKFEGYIIPGGFSYQDRIRAGVVAAKKSIMKTIVSEAEKGKPVLGICNGAQILVEAGMIPGLKRGELEMALAPNMMEERSGYYCDWVFLECSVEPQRCAFTYSLGEKEVFPLPIAHAEGRFITQKKDLLEKLIKNKQVILRYCKEDGKIEEKFPFNPNGSLYNIAGICNPKGNVFALMPHPERANWLRQVPSELNAPFSRLKLESWGSAKKMEGKGPGRKIFESMRIYIENELHH
jgi:phosphoribosylformylglycinamidine synthase